MLKNQPADEQISTLERAKLAYVYIRQSSPGAARQSGCECCDNQDENREGVRRRRRSPEPM